MELLRNKKLLILSWLRASFVQYKQELFRHNGGYQNMKIQSQSKINSYISANNALGQNFISNLPLFLNNKLNMINKKFEKCV